MTSSHTSKYQLSQWERSDKVLMEDFNSDNQKIEDALAGLAASKAEQSEVDTLSGLVGSALPEMPKVATGTYMGTGTCGEGNPTSLTFPFKPKLVVLAGSGVSVVFLEGQTGTAQCAGGQITNLRAAWDDATLTWYAESSYQGSASITVNAGNQLNASGVTYQYFIIG